MTGRVNQKGASTMTDYDEADVLQLAGADTERDKTNDRVPFRLAGDDRVYVGSRPKMAVLLTLVSKMGDDSDEFKQAAAFDQMLEKVLEPESAAAIRARLNDEKDALDLDSPGIINMFQTLVGLWYGRPTGRPAASRRPSSRTTRRSTARSR